MKELTDKQMVIIARNIMKLPGMETKHKSCVDIEYSCGDGTTNIKFMSDGGMTDNSNGRALSSYLMNNNAGFERFDGPNYLRGMNVNNSDLIRLFITGTVEKIVDRRGVEFAVGQTVAKDSNIHYHPFDLCTIREIKNGFVYLNDSVKPVRFPERMVVICV